MDTTSELMAIMLAHGYSLLFTPHHKQVFVTVNGPGFKSDKLVKDYATAVGLAAYWLSETNGVPSETKKAVNAILYPKD